MNFSKQGRTRAAGVMGCLGRSTKALGASLLALLLPASALGQGPTTFIYGGSQFQSYTVPATGWYFLDAQGAQGGAASNFSHQGGKGARMQGYAYLRQGAVLRIAVGGAGGVGRNDGNNVSGGGGGGGSSIVLTTGSVTTPVSSDIPLLFAAGGGGAAANYHGSPGLTSERAGRPNEGVDGNGGGIGEDAYGGAGGAGYRTDGGTHFEFVGGSGRSLLSYGGQAYLSGNSGGASTSFGGNGGWGGGGEGGPAVSSLIALKYKDGGGGGGGGFSGGGGGVNQGDGAGGGGSYVADELDTTLCLAAQGYRSGDGLVAITPVSGPPVVQQPANQQVGKGQAVTLGPVFNDPTGQTTYQWLKDGVVLVGQTSATLAIASFQFTDSGGYQAIVQQGAATSITLPAFLSPSSPLSTLQAWGSNDNGQLGLGDTNDRSSPVRVTSDVVAVAAVYAHSLFVKRDGTLWAMGNNYNGQLGLGDTNDRSSPVQVTSDVVAVAAGGSHSLFVKRDGTLWAMGKNFNGQLGPGDTNDRSSPVPVTSDVVAVAAGELHSLFVKRDGSLWAMGSNTYGQLGLGDRLAGAFNEFAYDRSSPVQVTSDVVAVAAGESHSLFVKRDGSLWAMGFNEFYQLGLGDKVDRNSPLPVTSDVVAVAAGYRHSLFVKRDGSLWAMGYNYWGQLGLGDTTDRKSPVPVTSDVVAVAGGAGYSLFVKRDGSLWAMGYNYNGELGLGDTTDRKSPVRVTSDVVAVAAGLFVKRDGSLWAMGDNSFGQLGLGDTTDRTSPAQVYFRDSANQPTTALVVATLPKMPSSSSSLAIAAPAPILLGGAGPTTPSASTPRERVCDARYYVLGATEFCDAAPEP